MIALAVTLSHSPASIVRTNSVAAADPLGHIVERTRLCQAREALPRDTSAIVVSLSAFHGPPVKVEVLLGARVVARGHQGSDWSGRTVTVPVNRLPRAIAEATICFAFSPQHEPVSPFGSPAPPGLAATNNGTSLPGRLGAEYLAGGGRSWWSLAASTAYRMGLGRASGGAWIAVAAATLMAMAAATASLTLLKGLG
jgi:hypothetical protein